MWKRDSPVLPPPAAGRAALARALRARLAPLGGGRPRDPRALAREPGAARAAGAQELGTSFERTGTLNVYETRGGAERTRRDAADGGPGSATRCSTPTQTRELEPALIGPVVGLGPLPATRAASTRGGSSRRSAARQPRRARRSARAPRSGRSTSCRPRPSSSPPAPGRGSSSGCRSRAARATTSTSSAPDDDPRHPVVGPGDLDDRDTAARPPAPLRHARARRARPVGLAAARRRRSGEGGERWFRGLARPAGARDLGGAAAVPARRPARDRPARRGSWSRPATR